MTAFDSFEQTIAARTIWGEARNQGDDGMKAVAHVLLNRLKTGRWGSTMGSVCLWPWQFSCWNFDDHVNRPHMIGFGVMTMELQGPARAFVNACEEQEAGTDPTNGATFYFNPAAAAPSWAVGHTPCAIIGAHQFYNDIS